MLHISPERQHVNYGASTACIVEHKLKKKGYPLGGQAVQLKYLLLNRSRFCILKSNFFRQPGIGVPSWFEQGKACSWFVYNTGTGFEDRTLTIPRDTFVNF